MRAGELLEHKMKRLLYHQGFLVRDRISLKSQFYPERVDITDIDVLGVKFLDDLSPHTVICECKSGRRARSMDRLLWLKGLSQYISANSCYFARERFTPKVKEFAISLKIVPIDYSKIEGLEKQLGIVDKWLGSHDYTFFHGRISRYYENISNNVDLLRIYWFLKSKFWYSSNVTRVKKLMTALDLLTTSFDKSENAVKDAIKWIFVETLILLSVAIVGLCSEIYPLSASEREEYLKAKLISNKLSPDEMYKIMRQVRSLAQSIVKERTGQFIMLGNKLTEISPPSFTNDLIDISERVLEYPSISKEVPRFMDTFFYEFTLKNQKVDAGLLEKFFPDLNMVAKMAKNVAKFACAESSISNELLKDLISF